MTTRNIPKNGFTVTWLDNLKSEPKRFEIPDKGAKGLRLRVSPGGAKTFVWLYRDGNSTRRVTIGQYGDRDGQITLAKARKKLVDLKDNLRAGIKPHTSGEGIPKTVTELCEAFYKRRILNSRKRPDIVRQVLDHDIIPIIGNRRLTTVTTTTLVGVVDKVIDRGARAHAGRVLSTIKQAFKWAQVRGYVELSPASPLDASSLDVGSNIRERALDVDDEGEAQAVLAETTALFKALDAAPRLSAQIRIGLKLLLLTGVRSGELRLARWEHVDLDNALWKIPASNTKNAKAWSVPLSDTAVTLFEELDDESNGSDWVLRSADREAPITDKAMARAVRRLFSLKDKNDKQLLDIPRFYPHDLRRTLRTHLSRLGVAPHIAEKCLNHSLSKIGQTYDKHTFIDERREALQLWANSIESALNPHNNVTILMTGS
jgi:integrase